MAFGLVLHSHLFNQAVLQVWAGSAWWQKFTEAHVLSLVWLVLVSWLSGSL